MLCRLDEKLPRPISNHTHGVDAVHDQIQHYQLQLHAITEHTWQIGGKIRVQGNTVSGQLMAQEPCYVLNDLVDVEFRPLGSQLYQHATNPRYNRAHACSIVHNVCTYC